MAMKVRDWDCDEEVFAGHCGSSDLAVGSVRAATSNWKAAVRRKADSLAMVGREPSHVNWRRVREATRDFGVVEGDVWRSIVDGSDRKPKEVK